LNEPEIQVSAYRYRVCYSCYQPGDTTQCSCFCCKSIGSQESAPRIESKVSIRRSVCGNWTHGGRIWLSKLGAKVLTIGVRHVLPVMPHGLVAEIKDVRIQAPFLLPNVPGCRSLYVSVNGSEIGTRRDAEESVDIVSRSIGACGFGSRLPCNMVSDSAARRGR
jgi:hypothetical protein